jgi:hypothetical protein
MKEKQSWFSSSFGFGSLLNRPYSWRLIAMAQNGNRNDRLKAVWLLANWKNMKGYCKKKNSYSSLMHDMPFVMLSAMSSA